MNVRHLEESDYELLVPVVDVWWGGRHVSHLLPKLFFVHFRGTSFVAEENGAIVGFLIGFVSQTFPDQAYIHFVGIHPDHRSSGLGRQLYIKFFETVDQLGCTIVRSITSPVNRASIAFHTRMGFQMEEITGEDLGVACTLDYELKGEARVQFVKTGLSF